MSAVPTRRKRRLRNGFATPTLLFFLSTVGITATATVAIYKSYLEFIVKARNADQIEQLREENKTLREENAKLKENKSRTDLDYSEHIKQKDNDVSELLDLIRSRSREFPRDTSINGQRLRFLLDERVRQATSDRDRVERR